MDDDANKRLYGREVSVAEMLGGAVRPPPEWRSFVYELRGLDLSEPASHASPGRTSLHAHSPSYPGALRSPSGAPAPQRTPSGAV